MDRDALHWKGICGLVLSAALQQVVNVLQINVKGRRHFLYTVPEDKLLMVKKYVDSLCEMSDW